MTFLGVQLTELNVILETVTLVLGVLAGAFALYFHCRRWLREKRLADAREKQ